MWHLCFQKNKLMWHLKISDLYLFMLNSWLSTSKLVPIRILDGGFWETFQIVKTLSSFSTDIFLYRRRGLAHNQSKPISMTKISHDHSITHSLTLTLCLHMFLSFITHYFQACFLISTAIFFTYCIFFFVK